MTLTREGIAFRVAQDLPDGSYVNLGVGIPALVAFFLPTDRDILLQSENGILGMGPVAEPGTEDPDLVSANKEYVTLLPGASVFDHALSFTMIRGGHMTHCVMGAMEISAAGDLANWRVPGQGIPGVGGAMDLAFGAQNVWIAMTHVSAKGQPKIVAECTYPLTAPRCVKRIFTDLAVIDVTPEGLVLREVAPGLSPSAVQAQTGASLHLAADWREMALPESSGNRRLLA